MFSVDDILLNNYRFSRGFHKMNQSVLNWTVEDVFTHLREKCVSEGIANAVKIEKIDGKSLLILNERDIYKLEHKYHLLLGDLKRFSLVLNKIQQDNRSCLIYLGILDNQNNLITNLLSQSNSANNYQHHPSIVNQENQIERISPANSVDGSNSGQYATCIRPEFFKTAVSLGELFMIDSILLTCRARSDRTPLELF